MSILALVQKCRSRERSGAQCIYVTCSTGSNLSSIINPESVFLHIGVVETELVTVESQQAEIGAMVQKEQANSDGAAMHVNL